MKILADADLPYLSQLFPKPFEITTYRTHAALQSLLPSHDVLLCRSTLRVNEALLTDSRIQCVATPSSGTCHIDKTYLQSHQIQLFDAKGCNAQAVADYVTSTIAWLEKNVTMRRKLAGVIGVGEVGSQVAGRLRSAGYDVIGYDPYQTMANPLYERCSFQALAQCDVLCIHANLHNLDPYPSFNLINADFISQLKPGVVLINASRGGIVNEDDLLNTATPIHYCTDVFIGEPDINPRIVEFATLCTPHIAGHSIEAKHNAIIQLSVHLHSLLNLKPPYGLKDRVAEDSVISNTLWRDIVLKRYNPYHETISLKKEFDKEKTFIIQRQLHTTRHDFAYYDQLCYI